MTTIKGDFSKWVLEVPLKKRQIVKPYLKAKKYLEADQYEIVDFKIRKPKSEEVYQFRITRKFRAFLVDSSQDGGIRSFLCCCYKDYFIHI